MQFESLKVFCDVARCRSVSQAAALNNLSQSAASQIVLQLEKRMGVQLVNRSTRPLRLTAVGKAYYEGCKGLVEQYLELEASIRNVPPPHVSTVQVVAIYSVGLGDMGQYVDRFGAEHPRVKVHMEYLHPNRVYERVLDGTADFGLVSYPRKSRELVAIPWREEEMVLACAPTHEFARSKTVKAEDLNGVKFIGFDKELASRREVDRYLREKGVTVDIVLEFDNIENIKKAVEISAGVSLLPAPTFRREVEAGSLLAIPLAGCKLIRPLCIIHRRHQKVSPNALSFMNLLKQARKNAEAIAPAPFSPVQPESRRTNGSHRGTNGVARSSQRNV